MNPPLYRADFVAFALHRTGGKISGVVIVLGLENRLTGTKYSGKKFFPKFTGLSIAKIVIELLCMLKKAERTAMVPGWKFELDEPALPPRKHGGMFCDCEICRTRNVEK